MDLGTWKAPRLHTKGRWHGLRHPGTEECPSPSLAGQRGDWRLERRDLQGAGCGLINWDGSRVHGSVCLGLAGVRTRAGTLRRGMVPTRRGHRTKVSDIHPLITSSQERCETVESRWLQPLTPYVSARKLRDQP